MTTKRFCDVCQKEVISPDYGPVDYDFNGARVRLSVVFGHGLAEDVCLTCRLLAVTQGQKVQDSSAVTPVAELRQALQRYDANRVKDPIVAVKALAVVRRFIHDHGDERCKSTADGTGTPCTRLAGHSGNHMDDVARGRKRLAKLTVAKARR